jgi:hypothetical protein
MKLNLAASALMSHYRSGSTTLAMCWKVTLTNGTVLGFTSLDSDVVVDDVNYLARTGFTPSATQGQSRLAVDNTELVALLDSDDITADDLTAGLWDFAQVQVFLVNWADPEQGIDILMTGRLGQVSVNRSTYTAELRGLTAAYAPQVGALYQLTCRATLGDARCGVDLETGGSIESPTVPFTNTGTVTAVSDNGLVLTDPGRIEPGPAGGLAITAITQANPPVLTVPAHGLAVGQIVYIAGVNGMVELNGFFYVVKAVPTANTLSLAGVDASGFGAYVSGGSVTPQGDAGFFDYGKITMTSGASAGLSMEIKAYSPGLITLQVQLPRGVQPGDTYSIQVGCGKRFAEDCVARFNNGLNFRGEPHLPGMDQVLRVGGQ